MARCVAGFLTDLPKMRALSAMARFSTTNQLNAAMDTIDRCRQPFLAMT